jgi:transcription initiation factor TFIIA large subunit
VFQGWQSKLSQLGVATFPWDPKPEPQPIANPPTVPSNAGNYQSMGTPPINQSQPGLSMPQISNGPRIKAEPGVESPHNMNQPSPYQQPMPALQNVSTAQQRAAAHLQQTYGSRATASINAIQSGGQPQHVQQNGQPTMQQMQMQMQQRQAAMQSQGQGMQQRPQMTQEQYNQLMARNAASRMQAAQQNGQHPQNPAQVSNGQGQNSQYQGPPQTDGPGDDEESFGVIQQGGEVMGRVEIDSLIRAQIERNGRHMEGGGLMLPLHKATASKGQRHLERQRLRQVQNRDLGERQMDGGDDDDVKAEELDEDAINSDLDDPDEGLNEEEDEDEGMGHIMLCMYDKVQRVKNKWYVPKSPFCFCDV